LHNDVTTLSCVKPNKIMRITGMGKARAALAASQSRDRQGGGPIIKGAAIKAE
jgi:hypothetical protein